MSCTKTFDSVVDAAKFRDELEERKDISKIILFGKYMKRAWCYTVHWFITK